MHTEFEVKFLGIDPVKFEEKIIKSMETKEYHLIEPIC